MQIAPQHRCVRFTLIAVLAATVAPTSLPASEVRTEPGHREDPVPAPEFPISPLDGRETEPVAPVVRGNFTSVQVNTNALGQNIIGDAANEPSMAIDPTDPDNIVIGWRQFNTIASDHREAGYAYSHDGGLTWTFPGNLEPGQFRSDPVLEADSAGNFYYNSLSSVTTGEIFISTDKGVNWTGPISARGGDKNWFNIDSTLGVGDGHLYLVWNSQFTCCGPGTDYTRSTDGGQTYPGPWATPLKPKWGTITTGPDGEVYFVGSTLDQTGHVILRSDSLKNAGVTPVFEQSQSINLGGTTGSGGTPNPGGLLGQVWVDVDHSAGPSRGNVYVLGSVDPPGGDPLDVRFIRSTDGGQSWTAPKTVNGGPSSSYQWFGTMSVAPNGRIDVVWNDTRGNSSGIISELYYAYSTDQGDTFSAGLPVSPEFNSILGHPQQNKIGDYIQTRSSDADAAVIYAATFNGEQDLYFLRVGDCNGNGMHDSEDVGAGGSSHDCNANGLPDECEADCNINGVADGCDIDFGTSFDCNLNEVPDECDIDNGDSEDCNINGEPDECDVTLDLETDEGWTVGADGDGATTGVWVRVDPNGTSAQPEDDHTPSGVNCFVTGQGSPGGGLGENDVDNGKTTLVSPFFDLTGMDDPSIGYWRWYSNDQGGDPNNDVFLIEIANDGETWLRVETIGPSGEGTSGGWIYNSVVVSDFVTPNSTVQLRFIAEDANAGSIIEAAIDDVVVTDCTTCNAFTPAQPFNLNLTKAPGSQQIAQFTWAPIIFAETYNLYQGDNQDATDLECWQQVSGTSFEDDGTIPSADEAFFYTVSAGNCAGESSLGSGRVPTIVCP